MMKKRGLNVFSTSFLSLVPILASCVGSSREVSVFEKTPDTNVELWIGQDIRLEELSTMTAFETLREDLVLFEEEKYLPKEGEERKGRVLYYARRSPYDPGLWRVSEVHCTWYEDFAGPMVYGIDGKTPAWKAKQKLVSLGYVDAKPVNEDSRPEFWKDGVAAFYNLPWFTFIYEWNIFDADLLGK